MDGCGQTGGEVGLDGSGWIWEWAMGMDEKYV